MRIRVARGGFVGGMFKDAVEILSMISQTDLGIVERSFNENRIDYVVSGGQNPDDPICVSVKRSQAATAQSLVRTLRRS